MKRFVALVLSLCMVFTMCITAGAADDKGLTEAVKAVKAVIDIPEEYSEFNYRTIQNESGYIWSLQWSSENGEVYVRINQDGEILSYSENSYTNDDGQWAKITCDEAKQMAQDFAKDNNLQVEIVPQDVNKLGYADTLYMNLDTEKIERLGWQPKVGLMEMFQRMMETM